MKQPFKDEFDVPARYELLDIDEVELDTTNPRVRKFVEMYDGEISRDQLELALIADASDEDTNSSSMSSYTKLRRAIQRTGRITIPIVVNNINGRYVALDGNTRVLIVQKFKRDSPLDARWHKIPALVYDDLPQRAIEAIRLGAHLVGPRAWDAYSKAKYLYQLRTEENLSWPEICEYSGGNAKTNEKLVAAYEDMEDSYRSVVGDGNFQPRRFSGYVELQEPQVKLAIAEAGFGLRDFAVWIQERKLRPLSHIRELPRILRHPAAREAFLKGDSKAAMLQLARPDAVKQLVEADVLDLARALTQRVQNISIGELEPLRANVNDLTDARDAIRMLLGILKNPALLDDGDEDLGDE